eukprot:1942998-Prymnesium_polylepis.1
MRSEAHAHSAMHPHGGGRGRAPTTAPAPARRRCPGPGVGGTAHAQYDMRMSSRGAARDGAGREALARPKRTCAMHAQGERTGQCPRHRVRLHPAAISGPRV